MSFCTSCGKPLAGGMSFCPACGASASGAGQAPPDQQAATPPEEPPADVAPADAAATQVTPPDEAATQVTPPDQAVTQVLPQAAGLEPTRIMPPPGAPAAQSPPPPGTPPFGYAPPTWGGSAPPPAAQAASSKKKWIIIGAIAAAVVVAILLAVLVLGGSDNKFVGTWAPVNGDTGGLIIADDLKVTLVNDDGTRYGPFDSDVKSDTRLEFKLSSAAAEKIGLPGGELITLVCEYLPASDHIKFSVTGVEGVSPEETLVELKRVQTIPTGSPSPTESPTESVSPSPTATPTLSPTTSPSASPSAGNDQTAIANASALAVAIGQYVAANGGALPLAIDVAPGAALDTYIDPWPTNPFTSQPMVQGAGAGNFTYTTDGSTYSLAVHLSDGTDHTLP